MYTSDARKAYASRRKSDELKTRKIERFVDKIYRQNNLIMSRTNDKHLQRKGVDLIHVVDGQKRYVDEKFALNYYDRDLRTYSFELVSHNNMDNAGWLLSSHMITTHYCILWFRSDENLDNIETFDLCYISKQAIIEYIRSVGYYDGILDDFVGYWAGNNTKDSHLYCKNGNRLYRKLRNGVRIVQSLQYEVESPINIVIPRDTLYTLAEYHFHA
jgi:hypothetical protein